MEKEHYVTFAYNDHLSDTLTYLQLSLAKKNEYFEQFHSLIDEILLNFQCFFHEGSRSKIYIRHHSKSQPAFMYLMPKIRKSGHLKTHTFLLCGGSIWYGLAVWADMELKKSSHAYL